MRSSSKAASVSTTTPASRACSSMLRAISVTGVRRSGAPGGTRDVVYHVDWERTPASSAPTPHEPLPLTRLHVVAKQALDQVVAIRGVRNCKPRWLPATR